jgi:hypothetical protein
MLCKLCQRTHVNDQAIFHVLPEETREGVIDLLDGNDFDIGGDAFLPQ